MRQETGVEIDRPIDEVFEYTNSNVVDWSIIVVEKEVINEKSEGVGTTFRCVTEENGKNRMEFLGTVTRHEPPNVSAIHLDGKYFDLDVTYLFEDLGGRTRITQQSTVTPKAFFIKAFMFLLGWAMRKSSCKATENELNNLKRLLEEGAGQRKEP
jgi:hypothetical protein